MESTRQRQQQHPCPPCLTALPSHLAEENRFTKLVLFLFLFFILM